MPLNSTHRRQFHEQGYLILNPEIPSGTLDAVVRQVEPLYPDPTNADGTRSPTRVSDAWSRCPAVLELAVWPRVLGALEYLYGRRPKPFQTLNFPVGTQQSVHADTVHFNTLPAGWMCGVWVALEDIHPDSGPLVFYPGSHHLPEQFLSPRPPRQSGAIGWLRHRWHRAMVLLGRHHDHQDYHRYEADTSDRLAEFGYSPAYGLLQKGQALIWAANLLHGGSPRKDPLRTRHSQVTHYYFEGVESFVPILSRGRRVHWTAPTYLPVDRPAAA